MFWCRPAKKFLKLERNLLSGMNCPLGQTSERALAPFSSLYELCSVCLPPSKGDIQGQVLLILSGCDRRRSTVLQNGSRRFLKNSKGKKVGISFVLFNYLICLIVILFVLSINVMFLMSCIVTIVRVLCSAKDIRFSHRGKVSCAHNVIFRDLIFSVSISTALCSVLLFIEHLQHIRLIC